MYSYHFTGYKQREKLSKSLKAHVNAIQSALKHYNEAAAQLNPPRPGLTWEAVVNAVTLADFDLLRDTRQDIRMLQWAQPVRATCKQEEIKTLRRVDKSIKTK